MRTNFSESPRHFEAIVDGDTLKKVVPSSGAFFRSLAVQEAERYARVSEVYDGEKVSQI
jgi:hypothetical protein